MDVKNTLRPYQNEIIAKLNSSWGNHSRRVMLQMPTGTGKTEVFSSVVQSFLRQNRKDVLILVHRKELVDQIILRLRRFDISSSRIQAGYTTNKGNRVFVGMVQSMKSRMERVSDIGLIIIDEAHHSVAKTYVQILRAFPSSLQLGVTATPIRLNGEGFRHLYDELICSYGVKEFMNRGFLANYRHIATSLIDLKKLQMGNSKDYSEESLMKVMGQDVVMANVVNGYLEYARGKKTIVFGVTILHCHMLAERFRSEGISAEVISSQTEILERSELLKSFIDGELQVMINVNIFSEGFDCPDIEAVILARPTRSISMYYQQVGRVLRPSEGKDHGLVLDNAMLWQEHGLVTQQINWSLEEAEIIKNTRAEIANGIKLPPGMSLPEIIEDDSLGMEIIDETNNHELVGIDIVLGLCAVLKGQISLFETLDDEMLELLFDPIDVTEEVQSIEIGETIIHFEEPFFTVGSFFELIGFDSKNPMIQWEEAQRLYSLIVQQNYPAYEEFLSWITLSEACFILPIDVLKIELFDSLEIAVRKGVITQYEDIVSLREQLDIYKRNTIDRVVEKLSISELLRLKKT